MSRPAMASRSTSASIGNALGMPRIASASATGLETPRSTNEGASVSGVREARVVVLVMVGIPPSARLRASSFDACRVAEAGAPDIGQGPRSVGKRAGVEPQPFNATHRVYLVSWPRAPGPTRQRVGEKRSSEYLPELPLCRHRNGYRRSPPGGPLHARVRSITAPILIALVASLVPLALAPPAAAAGVKTIKIADASIVEGDAGRQSMSFRVTWSEAKGGGPVSALYATADGTATAGSDYTAKSGTVTMSNSCRCGTISVPILGDTMTEGTKTSPSISRARPTPRSATPRPSVRSTTTRAHRRSSCWMAAPTRARAASPSTSS